MPKKWVVAAFWWLSYTVDGSLSVHNLTAAIDRWYEALCLCQSVVGALEAKEGIWI